MNLPSRWTKAENEKTALDVDRFENRVILITGVILAVALRLSLFPFESGDFRNFLDPWFAHIVENGGWPALRSIDSNYMPSYQYLLVLATLLPSWLEPVVAIKLVMLPFDIGLAWAAGALVRLRYPAGYRSMFAFLATLFWPTVFLNSGLWGQVDGVYTFFLLLSLYLVLTDRHSWGFIVFGVALAFKLQALFFAPVLLLLVLRGRLSWWHGFWVPAAIAVSLVPAWLAGRPATELSRIYFDQAGYYRDLTKNAPNLYQWVPNDLYDLLYPAGMILTVAVIFLLLVSVYKSNQPLTTERLIHLSFLFVVVAPYFLPKMHDRYFFPADLFGLVFAFYFPRYSYLAVVMVLTSLFSYIPFLFGQVVIPFEYLAFFPLAVLGRLLAQHVHLFHAIED